MNRSLWAKTLLRHLKNEESKRPSSGAFCRLPSNQTVKALIRDAKRVLFPHHFGPRKIGIGRSSRFEIAALLRFRRNARDRIASALLYEAGKHRCAEIAVRADRLAVEYCEQLPAIKTLAIADLNAHYEGDPAAENRDLVLLAYPGFYALLIHRLAHPLFVMGVPVLPRMMAEFAHRETGIDIHPGAAIGASLMIDHGTGVVIGETARIGDHVKIYQGVTLGAISTADGRQLAGKIRHPLVEDRVTIYAGASILGGETVIGHDSIVGSNAFITNSIPPFSKAFNPLGELIVKRKESRS